MARTRSGKVYNRVAPAVAQTIPIPAPGQAVGTAAAPVVIGRRNRRAAPAFRRQPRAGRGVPAMARNRNYKTWPSNIGGLVSWGMVNPAAWCYRRALLQCLLHIPEFVNFLNLGHRQCPDWEACTLCVLVQLVHAYWVDRSTRRIARMVTAFDEAFNYYYVDIAQKVTKDNEGMDNPGMQDPNSHQDPTELLELLVRDSTVLPAFQLYHQETEPVLRRLLTVTTQDRWVHTCAHGGTGATPPEPSCALTVPMAEVQRAGHVLQLDHYIRRRLNQTDTLPSDACKAAGCPGPRLHTERMTNAPLILQIALQRIAVNRRRQAVRIKDTVAVPMMLNMQEFSDSKKPLNYRLRAKIRHAGGLASGHHLAVVEEPNTDLQSACNDQRIQTLGKAANMLGVPVSTLEWEGNDSEDYVLFYSKDDE